jgi:hypothetical protein
MHAKWSANHLASSVDLSVPHAHQPAARNTKQIHQRLHPRVYLIGGRAVRAGRGNVPGLLAEVAQPGSLLPRDPLTWALGRNVPDILAVIADLAKVWITPGIPGLSAPGRALRGNVPGLLARVTDLSVRRELWALGRNVAGLLA